MIEHTIRHKDGKTVTGNFNRGRAIKAQCTECMGYGEDDPKNCTDKLCPLFPFRGKLMMSIARYARDDQKKPSLND